MAEQSEWEKLSEQFKGLHETATELFASIASLQSVKSYEAKAVAERVLVWEADQQRADMRNQEHARFIAEYSTKKQIEQAEVELNRRFAEVQTRQLEDMATHIFVELAREISVKGLEVEEKDYEQCAVHALRIREAVRKATAPKP